MSNAMETPFRCVRHDAKHIYVEFNVDNEVFEKRFDIRYVPTANKEEFEAFCSRYVESYRNGKQAETEQVHVHPAILATK